jgi:hypothetical protein
LATREQSLHAYSGISPALIVSIGGWGGKVAERLEKHLETHYGYAAEFPIVSILRFPCPGPEEVQGRENSINVAEKLQEAFEKSPHKASLAALLPDALRSRPLKEDDLMRPHYRAGFYLHHASIEKLCRDSLVAITAPEALASVRENANIPVAEFVSIYIIASLADEKATGILWDLSHLLKNESKNLSLPAKSIAFLRLPQDQAAEPAAGCGEAAHNASAYAALKELKFFADGGSTTLTVPDAGELTLQGNPFDLCYLFSSMRSVTNPEEDDAADAVSRYLSLDLDGFFSPRLKSARDQLALYLSSPILAFGTAEIRVPYEEIIDWCAKKLSHRALQQWGKKDTSQPLEDLMKRFYKVMEIKNPDKATEELVKKLGNPKETAWHLGRRLKELMDECKKEQLIDKLDEEYRRLGAEEVAESSSTLQQKVREIINSQEKLFSRALLELASDCNVGLFKLKNVITSLGSFLNRCHQVIDRRISEAAVKLDELERKRLEHTKELKKIIRSPLLFLQRARMQKIFDDAWQVCERSLEERLTLHLLTSALEYYLHMQEYVGRYREPVDSLIETYELLSRQLDEDLHFSIENASSLSISFVDDERVEHIYAQFVDCEEKTLCGVISALLSLIPLDLTDLSNKRVLRDMRNNAIEAMYRKARQCFEGLKEKPMVELLEELNDPDPYKRLLARLFEFSAPHLPLELNDSEDLRKIQLIGFFEGSYPQLDASAALVKTFTEMGAERDQIVDLKDEHRIVSLTQCSGLSLASFLDMKTWREDFEKLASQSSLELWKMTADAIEKTEADLVAGKSSAQ